MGKIADYILRSTQFVLTILCVALASSLINQQITAGTPTRVNYSLFASVWALFFLLIYLIPTGFLRPSRYPPPITPNIVSQLYHPLAHLVLDALTTLFLLAAAIALPAQLGVHDCVNRIYLGENGITDGGVGHSPGVWVFGWQTRRCREAQALTAFLWFDTAVFAAMAVVDMVRWIRKMEGEESTGPSARRPGSAGGRGMAQV